MAFPLLTSCILFCLWYKNSSLIDWPRCLHLYTGMITKENTGSWKILYLAILK
jgi:hypothetical protein